MEMTVDSVTLVVSEGETVSFGSSVILPASRTDLTFVKPLPSTTRDLPLIFTVMYEVSASAPLRLLRVVPRETSSAFVSVAE